MSKFDRVDGIYNTLTEDELERRLPEIWEIEDDIVREAVVVGFLDWCPDYFWEKPSSSTGKYHPSDERDLHGNWLHVRRVFCNFDQLARSFLERGKIEEHDLDLGRAAVAFHDMFKYGFPSEQNEHTSSNHDLLAGEFVRKKTDLPEKVARACETHNGAEGWGDGPAPETDFEELVHLADMVSAPTHMRHPIPKPSEELITECLVEDVNERN